jgi:hypothetical protein
MLRRLNDGFMGISSSCRMSGFGREAPDAIPDTGHSPGKNKNHRSRTAMCPKLPVMIDRFRAMQC